MTKQDLTHPPHYAYSKYEAIDVISDWQLNFALGNVVKYIARSGRKDGESTLHALKKAADYLAYEIKRIEGCQDV